MLAPLFALGNAFFFAVHNILTKKGLSTSNPTTAVAVSLLINAVFLWLVSILFIPLDSLATRGIFIFLFIGLFQPGLTRLLTYKGIETLGVAITDPIRATTPMFSALMAILALGEQMTLPVFCGTLLVIVGIFYLSHHAETARPVKLRYVFYPLLASVLAGFSQVLRKVGLGSVPHPILAAAVRARKKSCSKSHAKASLSFLEPEFLLVFHGVHLLRARPEPGRCCHTPKQHRFSVRSYVGVDFSP